MRRLVSSGVMLIVGLIGPPATGEAEVAVVSYTNDPRVKHLDRMFSRLKSPAQQYIADFLRAADRYDLDWRLLPSLSIIESGGGKEARKNNIFGWDSCKRGFNSVPEGIHVVAERLSQSNLYRGKDLDSKLRTYNQNAEYPLKVKAVMRRLGPKDLPAFN